MPCHQLSFPDRTVTGCTLRRRPPPDSLYHYTQSPMSSGVTMKDQNYLLTTCLGTAIFLFFRIERSYEPASDSIALRKSAMRGPPWHSWSNQRASPFCIGDTLGSSALHRLWASAEESTDARLGSLYSSGSYPTTPTIGKTKPRKNKHINHGHFPRCDETTSVSLSRPVLIRPTSQQTRPRCSPSNHSSPLAPWPSSRSALRLHRRLHPPRVTAPMWPWRRSFSRPDKRPAVPDCVQITSSREPVTLSVPGTINVVSALPISRLKKHKVENEQI